MKEHIAVGLCTTVVLLLTISSVQSEKILVLAFVSTSSHKITYMPLLEELAKRGHHITTLTGTKPFKPIPNITEISTVDWEGMTRNIDFFKMVESKQIGNSFLLGDLFAKICEETYNIPAVMEILNQKFDLVILQPLFNDCALGLIYRLGAPFVLFSPTSIPTFMASRIGGHLPPSIVPDLFSRFSDEMNFYERFINFWTIARTEYILQTMYEPKMTAIYRKKLGQDIPPVDEILANASLLLSNGHFIFSKPKPHYPDVVDVGGIHSRPPKPLPKDLEEFVTKSGKEGFILFSMGSAIKGDLMPEPKRQMFIKVFSKLKQQVLWKWENESMSDVPANVKLSKWLPQQDLLGHPNIKMFINHCGQGGTEESFYHGTPMLGLPMLADQHSNARRSQLLGILITLDWNQLTEEKLMAGIQEILNNPKYTETVKKLSAIFRDQPTSPLERAVFWVEYVMRHKGAPHLRSISRQLTMFQYHSIDVLGASVFLFLCAIYVSCILLKITYKLFLKLTSLPKTVGTKTKGEKSKIN